MSRPITREDVEAFVLYLYLAAQRSGDMQLTGPEKALFADYLRDEYLPPSIAEERASRVPAGAGEVARNGPCASAPVDVTEDPAGGTRPSRGRDVGPGQVVPGAAERPFNRLPRWVGVARETRSRERRERAIRSRRRPP
jgi:hypothetical protein